ncbi:polysaccharide biosynthesis protein, partial [Amylibacter sp.]|nr:polysaccharide biosynthesis protein [Amylibacter sp.]
NLGIFYSLRLSILYGLILFLSFGGFRFFLRFILRKYERLNVQRIIIFGAGNAGLQVLNSLYYTKEILAVAFLDDDIKKQNMRIGGLKVYGLDELKAISNKYGADTILLASPRISMQRRLQILNIVQKYNLYLKTIPSLSEIINDPDQIANIKNIKPEELLGRAAVKPVESLMSKTIKDKVVMVTGAGGSIGSELCRQIIGQNPAKLILFELNELALFEVQSDIKKILDNTKKNIKLVTIISSVQNKLHLKKIISDNKVKTIFHAAAYKHVPIIEDNIFEGALNNINGTLNLVDLSVKFEVENFILISSDKAVRPTNVMGATKRVCELILQAYNDQINSTKFSMVRFGNVLGSSGSVVPKFTQQILNNEIITVTHPEITRYFMTIPESANLVIQASSMAEGGDVFLLEMGDPIKIVDLAVSMIKLYGFEPIFSDDLDAKINTNQRMIFFTGLRQGEKLFEELLISKGTMKTLHPRIYRAEEKFIPLPELFQLIEKLIESCSTFDQKIFFEILKELPVDYSPSNI